jgi:hypothetical protein
MLESIGVLPDDEAVYRKLLSCSESDVQELAQALGRSGRR